jgi:hypothetical protein
MAKKVLAKRFGQTCPLTEMCLVKNFGQTFKREKFFSFVVWPKFLAKHVLLRGKVWPKRLARTFLATRHGHFWPDQVSPAVVFNHFYFLGCRLQSFLFLGLSSSIICISWAGVFNHFYFLGCRLQSFMFLGLSSSIIYVSWAVFCGQTTFVMAREKMPIRCRIRL